MMNLRGPASRRNNQASRAAHGLGIPPGATRSASSSAARHPLPSLAAVMSAPERRNMPHLHPQRRNGGLWFDIHDCLTKDIVAAWQADFWGPWWNYGMVPKSKSDAWWTSFVVISTSYLLFKWFVMNVTLLLTSTSDILWQKYYWELVHHDLVLYCWEDIVKKSIGNLVHKRKDSKKKPIYIGVTDWNIMLHAWEQEPAKKKSRIYSHNRMSNPDGLGIHRHVSGAKKHTRVAYEMSLEADGVPPPATEVVRKTHTRKDGTFIDKRAEAYVLSAQALASQRAASQSELTDMEPSYQQLTAAYIETATNKKGHVYGLGSIQYLNGDPNESAAASLQRNLDVDMRVKTMEDTMQVMKQGLDVLLRLNGIDPVTFEPTGQRTEGASSAATPSTPSVSVAQQPNQSATQQPNQAAAQQPNQAAAQQPNQTSPINLADMTPQSVEGFEFEDHH